MLIRGFIGFLAYSENNSGQEIPFERGAAQLTGSGSIFLARTSVFKQASERPWNGNPSTAHIEQPAQTHLSYCPNT